MNTIMSNWEKIAGLIFGALFATALLLLNVFIPEPSATQYATFRTILALAAAGVGGILAGTLYIKGSIQKWSVRAGGALALFLIVYFFTPAPASIAEPAISQTIEKDGVGVIHTGEGDIHVQQ